MVSLKKVIFKNRQVPLHYQIADYLLMMLDGGSLTRGERLPPEEELKEIFGVSRMTVRHATDHLVGRGLLVRKQGRGTYWTEKAASVGRGKLSGINREIFKITEKTEVKVISKHTDAAPEEVSKFLRIPAESEVIVFERLRSMRGEPISYTVNYLPVATGELVEKSHLETMTMMETLEKVLKIDLGVVEHVVEITRAGADAARHLRLSVLDPVLTVKTSIFDTSSSPVEIVWTHFVENKYKFRVVLDK